ncbi:MAG: class I SAM-dependent methyltransferase [Anaerolineales bacterium]|nr:class I SAM-dependent methyltransferase [Anaerolineales bacterium]
MSAALEAVLARMPRREGVYQLSAAEPYEAKETRYWRVRAREFRLYSDEIVRGLPEVPADHPLRGEWEARADSLGRLADHVARFWQDISVLDLGCGNGWMAHQLAAISVRIRVYGLDLNRRELTQAARVFVDKPRVKFLYGDVFTAALPARAFDVVVLASAIQYFPDLPALVRRLLALTAPGGEIHILDSPLYAPRAVPAARARTAAYYKSKGLAFMAEEYHHHTWAALAEFRPEVLYNPAAPLNRLARWWWAEQGRSPFPWLRITVPPDSRPSG